jgi:hypothetical protein
VKAFHPFQAIASICRSVNGIIPVCLSSKTTTSSYRFINSPGPRTQLKASSSIHTFVGQPQYLCTASCSAISSLFSLFKTSIQSTKHKQSAPASPQEYPTHLRRRKSSLIQVRDPYVPHRTLAHLVIRLSREGA